jgi:hypothetical protein
VYSRLFSCNCETINTRFIDIGKGNAIKCIRLFLTLYSTIFVDTKEIAFSIYAMVEDVGSLVVYLYSSTLTVRVSIILQMIYTGVAILCYIIVEVRLLRASDYNLQSTVLNNLVVVFTDETHSEKY